MNKAAPRGSRRLAVLSLVLAAVVLQANKCSVVNAASTQIWPIIDDILEDTVNKGRKWRLHWMVVDRGTTISSLGVDTAGDLESYTCQGKICVLFFLDLDPFAHFAHPTRILVFDPDPRRGDPKIADLGPTEWWPTIQESTSATPRSVFSTVADREDPSSVLHHGVDPNELPPPRVGFVIAQGPYEVFTPVAPWSPMEPQPTPTPGAGGSAAVCDVDQQPVWAVLVNGYKDGSDSFDEDVSGMYAVLRGFDVPVARIKVLSPIKPVGVNDWTPASEQNLKVAFEKTKKSMETCPGAPGMQTPHFLLFWSSHGSDETLYCDLVAGSPNQDALKSWHIDGLLKTLEDLWKPAPADPTDLVVTVVIEACKSGSVGKYLNDKGPHRRILTSTGRPDIPSYRDIDEPLDSPDGPVPDPNPADAGSETIWGYIEAFGTQTAHSDADGWALSFEEAAEYAKNMDVSFLASDVNFPRDIGVWSPDPGSPIPVHGASNTSGRIATEVSFTSPVSTANKTLGSPAEVDVVPGEELKVELALTNPGPIGETGALALRFFRNEKSSPNEWDPIYYEDNPLMRTTTMVPGIVAQGTFKSAYKVAIPGDAAIGDEYRLAVVVDSGQKAPVGAPAIEDPKTEIVFVVGEGPDEEDSGGFCAWLKNLLKKVFGA